MICHTENVDLKFFPSFLSDGVVENCPSEAEDHIQDLKEHGDADTRVAIKPCNKSVLCMVSLLHSKMILLELSFHFVMDFSPLIL